MYRAKRFSALNFCVSLTAHHNKTSEEKIGQSKECLCFSGIWWSGLGRADPSQFSRLDPGGRSDAIGHGGEGRYCGGCLDGSSSVVTSATRTIDLGSRHNTPPPPYAPRHKAHRASTHRAARKHATTNAIGNIGFDLMTSVMYRTMILFVFILPQLLDIQY